MSITDYAPRPALDVDAGSEQPADLTGNAQTPQNSSRHGRRMSWRTLVAKFVLAAVIPTGLFASGALAAPRSAAVTNSERPTVHATLAAATLNGFDYDGGTAYYSYSKSWTGSTKVSVLLLPPMFGQCVSLRVQGYNLWAGWGSWTTMATNCSRIGVNATYTVSAFYSGHVNLQLYFNSTHHYGISLF